MQSEYFALNEDENNQHPSSAGYSVGMVSGEPGVLGIWREDGTPFEISVGSGNTFNFPEAFNEFVLDPPSETETETDAETDIDTQADTDTVTYIDTH